MKKIILALALLPAFAFAASAPVRTADITFTAPTLNTDGTPITGTLTFRLYQGQRGQMIKPLVNTLTNTSVTVSTGLPGGEVCWQVSTLANGVESALSNEACKTFSFGIPQAVVITVN